MSVIQMLIRRPGTAAAVACLLCSSVFAMPPEGPKDAQGCGPDWRGGPPRPPMAAGLGAEDRPPPYLWGLRLSEDQDDKVFRILHAAAPEMRERAKAARKAREALRQLGQSAVYDEGKAASLAQALGSAESQLALLRSRTDHDIFSLLTPEQRAQVGDEARENQPHGGEGPWHGWDGPPRGGNPPPPRQ